MAGNGPSLRVTFPLPACYPGKVTRDDFENYLRYIYTKKSGEPLKEKSIRNYAWDAVDYIDKYVPRLTDGRYDSILSIDSLSELKALDGRLRNDRGFLAADARGKSMYSAGLSKYLEFAEGSLFMGKADRTHFLDAPSPARWSILASEREAPLRDRIKVVQLAKACSFRCEADSSHETFMTRSGLAYCEGHHLIALSHQRDFDNSLDCYANLMILCPTCHRLLHYGRSQDIERILHPLFLEREERYRESGLALTWPEFRELTVRPSAFYSY